MLQKDISENLYAATVHFSIYDNTRVTKILGTTNADRIGLFDHGLYCTADPGTLLAVSCTCNMDKKITRLVVVRRENGWDPQIIITHLPPRSWLKKLLHRVLRIKPQITTCQLYGRSPLARFGPFHWDSSRLIVQATDQ